MKPIYTSKSCIDDVLGLFLLRDERAFIAENVLPNPEVSKKILSDLSLSESHQFLVYLVKEKNVYSLENNNYTILNIINPLCSPENIKKNGFDISIYKQKLQSDFYLIE